MIEDPKAPHLPSYPDGSRCSEHRVRDLKLLFDLAYAASLEDIQTFLKTELEVIIKTPLVMLGGLGR